MEEKVQKKCRKVIFSAFLILAPEPYCQILLIYAKLAEFSRFLSRIQITTSRIDAIFAFVLSGNNSPSV